MWNETVQYTLLHTATVCSSNTKSFDLQPVGKEKYDPNAVTTGAVVASVGTGCGGFQGYFFPDNNSKSKLLSFNKKNNRKHSTPTVGENK